MFVCLFVLEQLVQVDDEDVRSKSAPEITRLLKGVPGSPVKLVLLRP